MEIDMKGVWKSARDTQESRATVNRGGYQAPAGASQSASTRRAAAPKI